MKEDTTTPEKILDTLSKTQELIMKIESCMVTVFILIEIKTLPLQQIIYELLIP